jgi:hypothetical protein
MADPPDADREFERRFPQLLVVVWAAGLGIMVMRGRDLPLYLLLSVYAAGILYALHLRRTGDPEGDGAIWWAALVPPLAWWMFVVGWLERRGLPLPADPDPGPIPADDDLRDDLRDDLPWTDADGVEGHWDEDPPVPGRS